MILAIIQARMGSSRLPGKMLLPIGNKPALRHVVDRARLCTEIDSVLVATSINAEDDALTAYCLNNDIPHYRGNDNDVLDRYYCAAVFLKAKRGDYIVRITGDCPFLDSAVCDEIIRLVRSRSADYASNTIEETYPDGLDCEVFTFEALMRSHREATHKFEREHVTQYIKRNPDIFSLVNLRAPRNLHDERWTLDEHKDYEFLCKVYSGIGKEFFGMEEVIEFLDTNPGLREINNSIIRNEGLLNSLKNEGML